jgi:hypothetical protein
VAKATTTQPPPSPPPLFPLGSPRASCRWTSPEGGNRIGAVCPSTAPTLEHLTGYEHASAGVGSSSGVTNITVDSTYAHGGSYSLRINKVSGSSASTGVERTYYS